MAQRTIVLKGKLGRRYDEARMASAGYPGYLVEVTSLDKYQPHSTRGGRAARRFLVEDDLQGKTIEDAYATNDLGRTIIAEPGDIINAVLHAGENVTRGDWIISYGDGTVAKAAAAFLADTVAASAAVTNTTTETAFSTGSVTIPKNSLKVGDVLRIRAQGIATSTNSTDTLNVKLKIGTDIIAATGAVDVANNDIFVIDSYVTIRTIGASGTLVASSTTNLGVPGTATNRSSALGSTAVDTTVDQTVTVTATWSVASASNSVRLDQLIVEHVKAGSSSPANGGNGGDVIGLAEASLDLSAEVVNDFLPIYIK